MRVRNDQIYQAVKVGAIHALAKKELPVLTTLRVFRLLKCLADEYRVLEEVRSKLIEQYATSKDERGRAEILPATPEHETFIKAFSEVLAEETELAVDVIEIPEQVDGKPFIIDAMTLTMLEPFLSIPGTAGEKT